MVRVSKENGRESPPAALTKRPRASRRSIARQIGAPGLVPPDRRSLLTWAVIFPDIFPTAAQQTSQCLLKALSLASPPQEAWC